MGLSRTNINRLPNCIEINESFISNTLGENLFFFLFNQKRVFVTIYTWSIWANKKKKKTIANSELILRIRSWYKWIKLLFST